MTILHRTWFWVLLTSLFLIFFSVSWLQILFDRPLFLSTLRVPSHCLTSNAGCWLCEGVLFLLSLLNSALSRSLNIMQWKVQLKIQLNQALDLLIHALLKELISYNSCQAFVQRRKHGAVEKNWRKSMKYSNIIRDECFALCSLCWNSGGEMIE